jgi:hypothetical protein
MRKNKTLVIMGIFFLICPLVVFSAEYIDIVNEGVILLKQGLAEEAINTFEKARKMKSDSSEIYYYLGEAYYLAGKRTEALENYKKAVELQDSNPDYHYSIALLYLSEGKTDEAIKSLNRVIEIAPVSITGRYAGRLKKELDTDAGNKEMVEKWIRLEEELKKKMELEKAKTVGTVEGVPPEFAGMMPGEEGEQKEKEKIERIPVEKVIKRVKFGTDTVRENSSASLMGYEQTELIKVSKDMIELIQNSKSAVKKNLINAVGKVATPEATDALLEIIQDKDELFDIKIVALSSVKKVKTEKVSETLTNTLKTMVEKREKERAEAKKNIQEITTKIENLEANRIKLTMDINQEELKKNEIQQKLQFSELPPDFAMMPQGQTAPDAPKPLTVKEIQKLRADIQKIDDSIKKKREESVKAEMELSKLLQQKGKYEALLLEREKKITDVTISGTETAVAPPPGPEFGVPPGMEPYGPEFGMAMPVRYEETDEDKNEVVFALQLIRAIGEMKDKKGLTSIRKGWDEYGIEDQKIYYLLALARLGDFNSIDTLVARLKKDYPQQQTQQWEEISLRKGIIEVMGEYIAQKPDNQLIGLIEFLSEESEHSEIRGAASSVLISTAKPKPPEKK